MCQKHLSHWSIAKLQDADWLVQLNLVPRERQMWTTDLESSVALTLITINKRACKLDSCFFCTSVSLPTIAQSLGSPLPFVAKVPRSWWFFSPDLNRLPIWPMRTHRSCMCPADEDLGLLSEFFDTDWRYALKTVNRGVKGTVYHGGSQLVETQKPHFLS